MLSSLKRQLPDDQHLSSLKIYADGRRVVAWDGRARWQPDSGQFLFDFRVGDLAQRAAPIARRHAQRARVNDAEMSAEDWFAFGAELEAVEPTEAMDAYRRALALDPGHADAHVNLGRLLQESNRAPEAVLQYREALRLNPSHATAAFNLGTALEDLRKPSEAIAAYRRAVALDERLADAHYNLSRLYEKSGQRQSALRHLRTYRDLMQ